MTPIPQNSKFQEIQEIIDESLVYLFQKPKSVIVSGLVITVLVFVGGLFFWASQLSNGFVVHASDQSELAIARSALQTMKRMVGDQQAWSQSIQEEYNRIVVSQTLSIKIASSSQSLVERNVSSKYR